MKKLHLITGLLAAVLVVSCGESRTEETVVVQEESGQENPMGFCADSLECV